MHYISIYFKELWSLLTEMSPYLLFGFLFAGLLHIYLQKEKVGSMLKGNNFRSVLNATLLGIPLPLCSCGVIPAGLSFHKNGASKGSTVSFLISTPQTGIDSILVTYSLLGLPFAIIRPFVALITGLAGGIAANLLDNKEVLTKKEANKKNEYLTTKQTVSKVLHYGFVEFIQDISKWLIIGLLLAALLAVIIPDDFFIQFIDKPWLNMLLVLAASVPLYICATGSVPIAAVLMMKGLSPGAALVFLMAGPATNIATITVLWKSLGKKSTLIYLTTIIIGSLFFGYLIDSFLPLSWFSITNHIHQHHHLLPQWLGITSSIVLIGLIINGFILNKIKERKSKMEKSNFNNLTIVQKYKVEGMTCKNCKAHVEKDVSALDGIDLVSADFVAGEVAVSGNNIDEGKIKETIESAGYIFKGKI
jgi:uncharacterized membrane protein YraQ (UPF0718 family)/copper chaperone CopZ